MNLKNRFFLPLIYLAFFICLLPAAIYTYKNPSYNFDMLGYMALVVKMDKPHSFEEIHKITYESARLNVPSEYYTKLTDTFSYRKKFAAEPLEFKKVLPNYIVKPLYLWSSLAFYKCGFTLPVATVLPSIVSYLLIGIFLFHWIRKYISSGFAFVAALLIMYSTFATAIAKLSTPDCLSAFFILLSAYFILEKRNLLLMSLFMLLSVYARVDNVIYCFFILSFLTFNKKWKQISLPKYLLMLVILLIAYISIMLPVKEFGWNIFYYNEYAKHIDYTRDFDQSMSTSSYFSLIYSKLVTAFVSTHFTLFLFLGLLVMVERNFSFKRLSFDQTFLLLLAAITSFRFLLLPDLSDRFYFGFYLIILVLLVRKFSVKNLKAV